MSDEETFSDDDHHEYDQDYLENIVFQVVEETPDFAAETCCFYLTEENISKKLIPYTRSITKDRDLSCLSNMLVNFTEAIIYIATNGTKNERYFAADTFLRFRHDFLHNFCMRCLNIEEKKTDEKFCDVFPFMISSRTPDRIIVQGKFVLIIETTATSDVKRSFITKGKIDEGFKSKYEQEISELINHDYTVEYSVIIFDMKDPTNYSYQIEIQKISGLLKKDVQVETLNKLEMMRGIFCNKSNFITKTLSMEMQNLLSDKFELPKPKLDNIDFLITEGESQLPNYDRIAVSTTVYSKINNTWSILPHILNKYSNEDNQKYIPVLEHSSNKFSFAKNPKGLTFDDMMKVLLNGDKPTFTRFLQQNFEGRPITLGRTELEFFEKVEKQNQTLYRMEILEQDKHINSNVFTDMEDVADYSNYIDIEFYKNVHHTFEVKDYEDKLINSLCKFYRRFQNFGELETYFDSLNKKPFCRFRINEKVVDDSVLKFDLKMLEVNDMSLNSNIISYQKQPFLHALSDGKELNYGDFKSPPSTGLKALSMIEKGDYTRQIYNLISLDNFTWGSRKTGTDSNEKELLNKLKSVQNELYVIQLDMRRKVESGKLPKLKDIPGAEDLKQKLSEANSELARIRGPHRSRISQVRIPTKKNSVFGRAFAQEMEHFKQKRSSGFYKGVGILNQKNLAVDFSNLKNSLMSPAGLICPDEIYFDHVSKDSPLLQKLKSDYLDGFRDKINYLKNTSLYASCAFVSRLCHSLSFYSQSSTGSDYVSIDNLGYENVILMVKGGKKIFKTKKSKLFRLLYPVHKEIIGWYKTPEFRSSCGLITVNNVDYLLTPWHTLDEVILNDGLTFLHRTMSYLLLSHEPSIEKSFKKNFFNIMLAFHSRRKTEELLHNLRYICVNSISNISRIDLMLPELADFNYDFFQSYIRSSLSKNYGKFSKILLKYNNEDKANPRYFIEKGLKSIFDDVEIENLEDLTVTIYSTFLMSKSPTNQSLEQVRNLKNMLKTKELHVNESSDMVSEQYIKNGIILEHEDYTKYWNNLFESDFNFDPAYCNLLGKFSSDYMSKILSQGEVNSKWMSIVRESWDDFANTKGLRGFENNKFFNRKGYFVVYDKVIKDSKILGEIKKLLLSDEDDFKKRKILTKLNLKYETELGCKNMKEAVFHVVDKKQRGGSREIFVMDLETKINQQAIEKFLAYLCKKVPNEAISVPSNKRLQHIHANVFEKFKKSDLETYNATLDCRKWAPHSVINKFIDMILGMSGFLPETFITHFLTFFSKMFNKKIYTRKTIKDIMLTNENTKDLASQYLIDDPEKNGAYMEMSYSWIMGIFNYMSSFMHVMNQLHASHIIRKVTSLCETDIVYYHMNAHSDDSGGKIQAPNDFAMVKTFFMYEMMLKSCNHLLSDKKCNISKRYFEFLSVLYISDTLLSLISKISGSFNFHPTDNGYCGDVNECYSKCIEMISLGATFDQAYLSMKISSHLIFKFYFNRNPTVSDHLLPPQLLGIPDGHPILVLISGSDADIIRLTYNDHEKFNKFLYLSNSFNVTNDLNDDIIKPIKVNPNIRKNGELIEHSEIIGVEDFDDDMKWIIKNLNTKNTGLKILKYGLMLNDKKFISALIDETVTRRISRAFHFRNHEIVSTPWGVITYKVAKICINLFVFDNFETLDLKPELIDGINKAKSDYESCKDYFSDKFTTYELMNFEVYGFMKSTEGINYTKDDIVLSKKTCKPIHINMQKTGLPTSQNFDPTELSIWIKYPEKRWMISLADDYSNKYVQLKNYLDRHGVDIDNVEPNWLYSFLQKLKSKFVKEYFIYSNMPADVRDVSNFQDFLCFLSHNSFKNKYIQGIMAPLGATVSQPVSILFRGLLDNEALKAITFVNYCFSLANNFELFKEVSNLKIDSQTLNCESDRLYDLVNEMISKWEMHPDLSSLIVPHLWSIKNKMDRQLYSAPWLENSYYYSFIKSQKLIGNVWLGKGLLYINLPRLKLEIGLLNSRIEHVTCDKKLLTFTNLEFGFINSVLMNANLPKLEDHFQNVDYTKWDQCSIGVNSAGLFCIDQNRNLKLSIPEFKFVSTFNSLVSKPSLCEISIEKNFSYKFRYNDDIFGIKNYNVNVLKIQPSEMLDLLNKMYDIPENRKIVENKGDYFSKYMKMFIGNVAGAEFRVSQTQLFDLLQSTRVYAIMSDLANKDIISSETLKGRKHVYPGQHGGLLSCLIDYKNIDENFDFDYNLILSPEMMALKSSQPEAFVTNLIGNLKEKYSTLYSSMDKEIIKKELVKLAEILDTDKGSKNLMSILMNWGYIGVMGSLEEMLFIKKAENYSGVRLYTKIDSYKKLNEMALNHLLKTLVEATEHHNYFNDRDKKMTHFTCKDLRDFKKTLISYIHSTILSSYQDCESILSTSTIEFLKICETLKILMNIDEFNEMVSRKFESNVLLSLIPVETKYWEDFCIMLQTLAHSYALGKDITHKLDFEKTTQHDHELIRPFVLTKEILKNTPLNFRITTAHNHGFISRERLKCFQKHHFKKFKNELFDINFSMKPIGDQYLPLNKFLFCKKRIKDEYVEDEDSDFADIFMELESEDPDVDSFNDEFLEDYYDDDYARTSRVFYKNEMVFAKRFDVSVVMLPQLAGKVSDLNFVRNMSQTVMIITNHFIPDLVQHMSKHTSIFHFCKDGWENFSLIDPDCLFAYLIDSRPIDNDLWSALFNMHAVDKIELQEIEMRNPTNTIINEFGNRKVIKRYSAMQNKLELFSTEEKPDDIKDSDENTDFVAETDELEEKLKNFGFDSDLIEQVSKFKKEVPITDYEDFYKRVFKKLKYSAVLQNTVKEGLKMKIKENLEDLSDVNQATKIFEVANVFSAGPPQSSSRKNKSLKDNYLRAEINGFSPNVLDLILSGRLAVSDSLKKEFYKHCRAMRKWALSDKKDREKKLFLIDLSMLIMNDAYSDEECNHDHLFRDIMSTLTNFIVTDEEDEEDYEFLTTYKKPSRQGRLYYDW